MSGFSVLSVLVGLVGMVAPIMILIGGVVLYRATRSGGSILLMIGGGGSILSEVGSLLIPLGYATGMWDPGMIWFSYVFPAMKLGGILAWLLIGAGVLILAHMHRALWNQNQALESIVAGSRGDGRVA